MPVGFQLRFAKGQAVVRAWPSTDEAFSLFYPRAAAAIQCESVEPPQEWLESVLGLALAVELEQAAAAAQCHM